MDLLKQMLEEAKRRGASDLHLSEGLGAALRVDGRLALLPETGADMGALILSLMDEKRQTALLAGEDQDFALERAGLRCRVNVYRHRQGLAAAIRLLSDHIPSLEELGLEPVMMDLARAPRGLVLLTGPTGSGKSTTLAAMIDYILRNRPVHIITIEDPVEYLFQSGAGAIVHQRELGESAKSFAAALRSALREDPDVILVGEMRDYETISTAVTAAETGHLVLSTLHTVGAAQTIDRIVDSCPPQGQSQMRSQLSAILRGVVTQQLVPLAAGRGRMAVTEVLVGTDAVCNTIRENKCHQLPSLMQAGGQYGMHTLNGGLSSLVNRGLITRQTAMDFSFDTADLKNYFM